MYFTTSCNHVCSLMCDIFDNSLFLLRQSCLVRFGRNSAIKFHLFGTEELNRFKHSFKEASSSTVHDLVFKLISAIIVAFLTLGAFFCIFNWTSKRLLLFFFSKSCWAKRPKRGSQLLAATTRAIILFLWSTMLGIWSSSSKLLRSSISLMSCLKFFRGILSVFVFCWKFVQKW